MSDLVRVLGIIMPFLFAGVIVIGALYFQYARRRETEKTIRIAIEKGMTLDPAVIEKMLPQRRYSPLRLRIWGIILIFLGIGLAVMHIFVGGPDGRHGPLGPGIMLGIVGIGMIVASSITKPDQPTQPPQT